MIDMNFTWTETLNTAGRAYWATEIGKYRFVIEDNSDNRPYAPFFGTIELSGEYARSARHGSTVEVGEYKTLASAKAGLKRRAAKYGI
jgi:hypothetical protein